MIGGGPIGCEMAQAFARLGCEVTIVQRREQLLPQEDPAAAAIVSEALRRDGVSVWTHAHLQRAQVQDGEKLLTVVVENQERTLAVDEILVGVGREPNVEDMGLERVDVRYGRHGVKVNDRLQTTNRRIYAVGDCCSRHKFTHAADAMARMVVRNALFGGWQKVSNLVIPWCTYTDPELAHVGLHEHEARQRHIKFDTFVQPMDQIDRAILDGRTVGFVKVLARKCSHRILGATIVSAHAGEMIGALTQAMVAGTPLGRLSAVICPYPTLADAVRKTADACNRRRLTPLVRKGLDRWLQWQRR